MTMNCKEEMTMNCKEEMTMNCKIAIIGGAIVGLLSAISASLFAAELTIPNTFQPNTPAFAGQVNDNFSALVNGINANDTRISAIETTSLPSANAVMAYAGTAAADGALARSFNSTGGTNTLAGSGGAYTVTLGGIDCGATTGTGIAVAQAAGASGISCRVNGDWNNVSGGCRVFVGCFNTAGNLTATPFSLIYMR
jgi:hypothetical protein